MGLLNGIYFYICFLSLYSFYTNPHATTDPARLLALLQAIFPAADRSRDGSSSSSSSNNNNDLALGQDRWLTSTEDPFVVAAGLRCPLPLRTSHALLMAARTWGRRHPRVQAAALRALAHVLRAFPTHEERLLLGRHPQGGVETVAEALAGPSGDVQLAAVDALLAFLSPPRRPQQAPAEAQQQEGGDVAAAAMAPPAFTSFTHIHTPAGPGPIGRRRLISSGLGRGQEDGLAERDQLAALMVQPPASVHTALVRLLEALLAEHEAPAAAAAATSAPELEEKEDDATPLARRTIALLAALLEADPPVHRSGGSGSNGSSGHHHYDDDSDSDAEDGDDHDPFSPSSTASDEGRNLADALAMAGLGWLLLRLMKKHPQDGPLHRLGGRAFVWLLLLSRECCPYCVRGGPPHTPGHVESFLGVCGVLLDAVTTFTRLDDPATLTSVLAAFCGVVRDNPPAAVTVVAGVGMLGALAGLLARFPWELYVAVV